MKEKKLQIDHPFRVLIHLSLVKDFPPVIYHESAEENRTMPNPVSRYKGLELIAVF